MAVYHHNKDTAMSLLPKLQARANNQCELCQASEPSKTYSVPPHNDETLDHNVVICMACHSQILEETPLDENHWRCLNDSMWSTHLPVQVLCYQLLSKFTFDWTNDLRDMLYLDEDALAWAESGLVAQEQANITHRDCNGAILSAGDSVTLVKDLNVKGAGFTAKRGTAVRNIGLVPDNAEHIEGRVNDQRIVILTQYVKKN